MNQQKGISLIIAIFVIFIALAVVLNFVAILFTQINVLTNIGNSVSAFYAADTGTEKTFHLNVFSPQTGQSGIAAGFCGICDTCQDTTNDCTGCALTPLSPGGCDVSCTDCKITYSSVFNGRNFDIETKVTPQDVSTVFTIDSRGFYLDATRTNHFDSSK